MAFHLSLSWAAIDRPRHGWSARWRLPLTNFAWRSSLESLIAAVLPCSVGCRL